MNNEGIEKIINRAVNLFYVVCGLAGASITLCIICALGKEEAIWIFIPVIPLIFIAFYHWGLMDALEIIIEEEIK